MGLSWEILSMVTSFLDKEHVKSLRQVNKYWNQSITFILCQTLIFDPLEEDQEAHRIFLKNYGMCADKLVFGYLGLGNVSALTETEIEFIKESFPKISNLEFNICRNDPKTCALGLLKLCDGLPKLKHLYLRGTFDNTISEIIEPLSSRLKILSLGKLNIQDKHNKVDPNEDETREDGLSEDNMSEDDMSEDSGTKFFLSNQQLSSLKELRVFLDDDYSSCPSFNFALQKLPNLDTLFYNWCSEEEKGWVLIDVKKSTIKQLWLSTDSSFEISVDFDVERFNPKLNESRSHHIPDDQLNSITDFIESDEFPSSKVTFPPIKSISLTTEYDGDTMNRFLRWSVNAPHLLLSGGLDSQTWLPQTEFECRRLVFKDSENPYPLVWASKWLPHLTDLFVNGSFKKVGLKNKMIFKSLVSFYTCKVQPLAFWTKLIKSSNKLKYVLLSQEDPNFNKLKKSHKKITFAHWSEQSQAEIENTTIFDQHKYNFYKIDI